jgi:lysophospholipase L1-like esterase
MKAFTKIIVINLTILGCLLFMVNAFSVLAIRAVNWMKPEIHSATYRLPNYAGRPWAQTHFHEVNQLESQYEAYYGWRRLPFHGETINLDQDGLRATWRAPGAPGATVAFFGGSTTWGTGARDAETIPSEFVKLNPGYRGVNFGESGYMAHQSLNLLMKGYGEGFRPELVVFYDGVNDTGKCRRELDAFSHAREFEIRSVMREGSVRNPESFGFLFLPVTSFVDRVGRVLGQRGQTRDAFFDCDTRTDKAHAVARALLQDWLYAQQLVEGYGGTFVAALQPVAYLSHTRLDHLKLEPALGRQYEVVYPLILELLAQDPAFAALRSSVLDLRTAVDLDRYLYIDWCHLSPEGNQEVAARISEGVAQRLGPQRIVWPDGAARPRADAPPASITEQPG